MYAGRIRAADLLGVPDLLRREPYGYVPGDIKSGARRAPRTTAGRHPYAVQFALYVDILERQGRLTERRGFVWDRHGEEMPYDLTKPQGKRGTLWQDYKQGFTLARGIAAGTAETRPAYAAPCKLCHWYSSCTARLKREDDLTLLPELGREKRDAFSKTFPTVKAQDLAVPEHLESPAAHRVPSRAKPGRLAAPRQSEMPASPMRPPAPICRRSSGSITPKIDRLLYAENRVAPLRRRMTRLESPERPACTPCTRLAELHLLTEQSEIVCARAHRGEGSRLLPAPPRRRRGSQGLIGLGAGEEPRGSSYELETALH